MSKRITVNALSSVVQAVFSGVLYFFLYRYLLGSIGVKLLGVWAIVLSASSIANLANFGLTSGLVKFTAEFVAEKRFQDIGKLIFTSFLSLLGIFSFLLLVIFFLAKFLLTLVVDANSIGVAFHILPYSLICLFINVLSGVFTTTLEGYQKNYIRNYIYVFTGAVFFVLVVLLTPKYGIIGVAYAQVGQALLVMMASLYFMFRVDSFTHFSFWRWDRTIFRMIFSFGAKFQLISICQLMYEPLTKMMMGIFGGMAFVGYYEMASRLINQFRAVVVNANQVLVPVIAHSIKVDGENAAVTIYKKTINVLLIVVIPISAFIVVLTPLISILWIGSLQNVFIYSMYFLLFANIVNIFCGPAYFGALAEGRLDIILYASIFMAIFSPMLSYLFSGLFGGYAVVVGWSITLALGSLIIIGVYHNFKNIRAKNLINKKLILFVIALLLAFLLMILVNEQITEMQHTYWYLGGNMLMIIAFLTAGFYLNRVQILKLVRNGL